MLPLAACGAAPESAASAGKAGSGYPIGAVFSEARDTCANLSSNKAVFDNASKAGWKLAEISESSPIAPLVARIDAMNAPPGTTLVGVPPMRKIVAGEELFLLISELRVGDEQVVGCRILDPAEERVIEEAELVSLVGRNPTQRHENIVESAISWLPGLKPGHARFEFLDVPDTDVAKQHLGISGLGFVATESRPLSNI